MTSSRDTRRHHYMPATSPVPRYNPRRYARGPDQGGGFVYAGFATSVLQEILIVKDKCSYMAIGVCEIVRGRSVAAWIS